MLKRLATVIWWIGTLSGSAIVLTHLNDLGMLELFGMLGAFCYLAGCAICFVLGGSFWKPPKL